VSGGWAAVTTPLQDQHDVLLLDLDGVVYVGPLAVPGAVGALAAARAAGSRLAFVTNNAARTADAVARHLSELGVAAVASEVVTSAQAAASLLAGSLPPGSAVLVVGGEGLRSAVTAVGLRPVASADDEPAAVVQGFAPEVGWTSLLEACVAVRAGVPWVATNPDRTLPTPRGPAPGNGALVDVVRRTTGVEPTVAGKPFRPIMDEAVLRTGATRPLVVGDRLDTDIAGAQTAGLPSMLVLTGVSAVRDLLAAPPGLRPTFVAADLAGLATPHPACARTGAAGGGPVAWACGGVTAQVLEGGVAVVPAEPTDPGPEHALAALRAVCSAVWASVDAHGPGALDLEQARSALVRWTAPHGWDR
jgi:HAD superfamily hydrolase (TIGR01450 family)